MKPILFSAPMIRAILDGRKTQTRRVVKPQPPLSFVVPLDKPGWFGDEEGEYQFKLHPVGTELWVREGFATVSFGGAVTDGIYYQADVDGTHRFLTREGTWETHKDGQFHRRPDKWKPSIHMPRWASRITLRVTGVKVERLQDISDEDAKAEGVTLSPERENRRRWQHPYGYQFQELWTSINGPGSWDANPWVAAYSFERVLPK